MKKSVLTAVFLTAISICSSNLPGQTFTPAPGFQASLAFDHGANSGISGLALSDGGDMLYFERLGGETRLMLRPSTGGGTFGSPVELFNYESDPFASFVTVSGNTVYFAESSAGTIRTVQLDGTSPQLLATVSGSYELSVGTQSYLSADASGTTNEIFLFDTSDGSTQSVVDTEGDFSGPIALLSNGNLLYGTTSFISDSTPGLYQFTALQLADAASSGTPLTLADGELLFANAGNQYLALENDETLWQSLSPFGSEAEVNLYDLTLETVRQAGLTGSSNEFISGLAFHDGWLYVSITDWTIDSTVVFAVIPEPSAALFLAFGLLAMALRRRRRRMG